MWKRKEAIQKSKAVSTKERDKIIKGILELEIYVPCEGCDLFNSQNDYCMEFKATIHPYIQIYGCGKGIIDLPF